MEINLTPELQAKLSQVALESGRDTQALIQEAIERFIDYDEWFLREVEKGLVAADQGRFLEHEHIRWTEPAANDLTEICDYIKEQKSQAIARKVAIQIYDAINTLERFPNLGRPGRQSGTRELVFSGLPYLAVYRVRGNIVEINRILHGAQRWP
jgi:toxin ParE1/3/4